MDKNEFLDLEMDAQLEKLNSLLAEGKDKNEAAEAVGCDLKLLMQNGLIFVKDKFMGKAFRGYGTAKSSANEHKHEGAIIAEKGADVNLT
ncbi:MAG: hypothetical protein LBG97_00090 [Coriobacteriales bacterium]|jgi:hypothetical protein|nr:hypothetical protein [Coriobacteriales bacterium]